VVFVESVRFVGLRNVVVLRHDVLPHSSVLLVDVHGEDEDVPERSPPLEITGAGLERHVTEWLTGVEYQNDRVLYVRILMESSGLTVKVMFLIEQG
jgi:hypothetical protein